MGRGSKSQKPRKSRVSPMTRKTRKCNEEKAFSSINGVWKTRHYMQNNETGSVLYHTQKTKWIKDLNERPETTKLLEGK